MKLPRDHHVTIPDHEALRIGTLASILSKVAEPFGLERAALIDRLFGKG